MVGLYLGFLGLLVVERFVELLISRRNAAWAFARGGVEVGHRAGLARPPRLPHLGGGAQNSLSMTLPPDHRPPDQSPVSSRGYWRRNLTYVGILLAVWFAISYGAGILFVERLNRIRLPGTGFPLGFWFAQQGAIYVFVILIFVYVFLMNRLDREFGVEEDAE